MMRILLAATLVLAFAGHAVAAQTLKTQLILKGVDGATASTLLFYDGGCDGPAECEVASIGCVEAGEFGAIHIPYADQTLAVDQRNNNLRTRRRIAGDMSGERVHIPYQLRLRVAAAVPQTPLPTAMRTHAGWPWNGPTTSSLPSKK